MWKILFLSFITYLLSDWTTWLLAKIAKGYAFQKPLFQWRSQPTEIPRKRTEHQATKERLTLRMIKEICLACHWKAKATYMTQNLHKQIGHGHITKSKIKTNHRCMSTGIKKLVLEMLNISRCQLISEVI